MMTRRTIEEVKTMCGELMTLCDGALAQLDKECWDKASWSDYSGKPAPTDYSYGSAATGALRRRSLDLTRLLALMRSHRP